METTELICAQCDRRELIPMYAYENDTQNWGWILYHGLDGSEVWYCQECDDELLEVERP